MNEIVVLENVKYRINTDRINRTALSKSIKDLENGVLFVSYGIDTGEILGRVNKLGKSTLEYTNSVISGAIASPLILFCETISQAKAMFDNVKKDKTRFTKLAAEVQKQKMMDASVKQFSVVETTQSLDNQVGNKSNEMGKRLALNNGIFKSNDNYFNGNI